MGMFDSIMLFLIRLGKKTLPNRVQFFLADLLGDAIYNPLSGNYQGSVVPKERLEFLASLLDKCIKEGLEGNVIEWWINRRRWVSLSMKRM